ncbi:MAG: hypothetical protein ACRDKY_02850 [Solirubrobacteraceae bacterium]
MSVLQRATAGWLIAALALLLVAAAAWPLASGPGTIDVKKLPSGFDATGTVGASGRVVRVHGPIVCTKDMAVRLDVTVTQRKTGALGRGTWRGLCTGSEQRWKLADVRAVGAGRFSPGRVMACTAGVLRNSKGPEDAVQWCESVRLKRP